MEKILFLTCGTSLLSNTRIDQVLLKETAQYSEDEFLKNDNYLKRIDAIVAKANSVFFNCDLKSVKDLSAEINTLFHLYKNMDELKKENLFCYLIHTDTYQGKVSAEIIHKYLTSHGIGCHLLSIKNLRVDSEKCFHEGMNELIRECDGIIKAARKRKANVEFLLSGGFKSVIGVMQVFGMLYADVIYYIFQEGSEILKIPKMPIEIKQDISEEEFFLLRKLSLEMPLKKEEYEKISPIYYYKIEEQNESLIGMSSWGAILFEKYKEKYYQEKILDSVIDEVKIEKSFKNAAEKYKERYFDINEKLDDLQKYKRTNQMLKSLNYKKLPKVHHGCTHEFYAWSDDGADRCFATEENGKIIVKHIDKHL